MIVVFKSVADLQMKGTILIKCQALDVGFDFNFLLLWKYNSKAQ